MPAASAGGAGDAAISSSKNFLGKFGWMLAKFGQNFGEIRAKVIRFGQQILQPQKHSISYGYACSPKQGLVVRTIRLVVGSSWFDSLVGPDQNT